MAETTIGWTATRGPDGTLHPGFTFNPWIGCSEDEEVPGEMSPECAECYAREGQNHRVSKAKGLPLWGATAHRQVTSVSYWKQPLRWNRLAAELGVRLKVFCASLCDIFEDFHGPLIGDTRCWSDLDDVREALWQLIEETPRLDWLLLTKRPQNIAGAVPWNWLQGDWPRNVWLGCTVEDQQRADERLPHLLATPAAVRFVSYEPALGPVDFTATAAGDALSDCDDCDNRDPDCGTCSGLGKIDWLIVGGESGPGARPFDLAWARSTVEACRGAGVPVFVKQLGARAVWGDGDSPGLGGRGGRVACVNGPDAICASPGACVTRGRCEAGIRLRDRKGGDMAEWPEDLRVQEFPEARP